MNHEEESPRFLKPAESPLPTTCSETIGTWKDGADQDGIAALFDEVVFKYVVMNNGTVTLTNSTITDIAIPGTKCLEPSLPPGASFTCDNVYVVSADRQQRVVYSFVILLHPSASHR